MQQDCDVGFVPGTDSCTALRREDRFSVNEDILDLPTEWKKSPMARHLANVSSSSRSIAAESP